MKTCLMIEGQENVTWQQWTALAAACEANGFDALFRSDHYTSLSGQATQDGTLDAWTTLAGLAAVTTTLRLGTLVSPVTFRHPSLLAKSVVTVDHISGGRVELGMGAAWNDDEHRQFGFSFPPAAERMSILEEQVEIVHRLWNEDTVTYEGQHYRLDACRALPKPVQDPHPSLLIGGQALPRSVALAVRWADEYNLDYATADGVRERRHRLDAACESAERDPATLTLSIMALCLIGSDRADLEAKTRRLMALQGEQGDPAAYLETQLSEGAVCGTPDQVLEQLAQLADAGLERIMLQHLVHDDIESVELIGREVIPQALTL
ncbi:MAG: LLM class F420-dependent oxidoreductase [Actinobacteria bacterium]|nr:LLM class F420-dependent oxidoreductase [Actinomycetota bacterium]